MTEEYDLCLFGHALPEILHELGGTFQRHTDRVIDIAISGFLRKKLPGAVEGAVLLIAGQDFVTRPQVKASGDDVNPGCGVGNENKVIPLSAQVLSQNCPRIIEQFVGAAAEKFDRL